MERSTILKSLVWWELARWLAEALDPVPRGTQTPGVYHRWFQGTGRELGRRVPRQKKKGRGVMTTPRPLPFPTSVSARIQTRETDRSRRIHRIRDRNRRDRTGRRWP